MSRYLLSKSTARGNCFDDRKLSVFSQPQTSNLLYTKFNVDGHIRKITRNLHVQGPSALSTRHHSVAAPRSHKPLSSTMETQKTAAQTIADQIIELTTRATREIRTGSKHTIKQASRRIRNFQKGLPSISD